MTARQRREAASRWLAENINKSMSAADIRGLALRFRLELEFNPDFRGLELAGRELAAMLDTAARIRAREEKKL